MTSHSQNLKLKLNSRAIRALRLLKVLQNHQKRNKVKSSTLATTIIANKTDHFDEKKILIKIILIKNSRRNQFSK